MELLKSKTDNRIDGVNYRKLTLERMPAGPGFVLLTHIVARDVVDRSRLD
jgi:hypothetical protein